MHDTYVYCKKNINSRDEMYEKNDRIHRTDHKAGTDFAKELNITSVLDKIQDCKRSWIQHVNRMPRNRLHRMIKNTSQKTEGSKEYH
jgi:hypothetical protein